MLRYRLLFGPIMIVALLAVLYVDSLLDRVNVSGTFLQSMLGGQTHLPAGLGILAVLLVLVVPAGRELATILRAKQIPTYGGIIWFAATLGIVLIYAVSAVAETRAALALYATAVSVIFAAALLRHSWGGHVDGATAAGGGTLLAFTYLGVLPSFFLAIRQEHAVWVVAAVILVTKSCDIGAYFTGRALGRHKLIPWLSPGKTWEGLIGGMVLAGLAGAGLAALGNETGLVGQWVTVEGTREFRPVSYPVILAALAGVVLGGVGQLGDLVESLFKRDAGVKDSASTLPGFGGVLDVVDSPIIVAPLAYWLLRWLAGAG